MSVHDSPKPDGPFPLIVLRRSIHWMVPMRIVPVLVLEEKAEYDDEESFLSSMKSSMKIIRNSS